MNLSREAKLMCGIILITIPTIEYGGTFLLTVISGQADLPLTDFQKSMFRAGHAHAGVLVILGLIAQILVDNIQFGKSLKTWIRGGFLISALLVSGGFFAAAIGENLTKPNEFIWILWLGVVALAISLITLGIGLIKSK
jgi:hypothetical protein